MIQLGLSFHFKFIKFIHTKNEETTESAYIVTVFNCGLYSYASQYKAFKKYCHVKLLFSETLILKGSKIKIFETKQCKTS